MYKKKKNIFNLLFGAFVLYSGLNGFLYEKIDENQIFEKKRQEAEQFIDRITSELTASRWEKGGIKIYTKSHWLFSKYKIYLNKCISEEDIIKIIQSNKAIVYYPNFYTLEICKNNIHFFNFEPSHIDNDGKYCGNITFWIEWNENKTNKDYCLTD